MLILIYNFIKNVALPHIGAFARALFEPTMIIVIMVAGIVLLFGAAGFKISNNLGSTVIGGIFRAIGYVCRSIIQGVAWIIRSIFRMIPRLFNESRRTFRQMGLSEFLSNLLSLLTTLVVLAIII